MKFGSILLYSLLRLAVFLVPFGLMMMLPIFQDLWWLAAIFSAVIGLSLSILVLRRPLNNAAASLADREPRQRRRATTADEDAAAEDATDVSADERPGDGDRVHD